MAERDSNAQLGASILHIPSFIKRFVSSERWPLLGLNRVPRECVGAERGQGGLEKTYIA